MVKITSDGFLDKLVQIVSLPVLFSHMLAPEVTLDGVSEAIRGQWIDMKDLPAPNIAWDCVLGLE